MGDAVIDGSRLHVAYRCVGDERAVERCRALDEATHLVVAEAGR